MANYKLDMTGEAINNTLKDVEKKATKTDGDEAIAAIAGSSVGGGIGIEVGEVPRNSSATSTYTLQHPSLFVIASNGRQNYYDELATIGSNELSFTVLLTPGAKEDTCANATNKRQDSLSLSADGKTLTLSAKGWSCRFISFYQL